MSKYKPTKTHIILGIIVFLMALRYIFPLLLLAGAGFAAYLVVTKKFQAYERRKQITSAIALCSMCLIGGIGWIATSQGNDWATPDTKKADSLVSRSLNRVDSVPAASFETVTPVTTPTLAPTIEPTMEPTQAPQPLPQIVDCVMIKDESHDDSRPVYQLMLLLNRDLDENELGETLFSPCFRYSYYVETTDENETYQYKGHGITELSIADHPDRLELESSLMGMRDFREYDPFFAPENINKVFVELYWKEDGADTIQDMKLISSLVKDWTTQEISVTTPSSSIIPTPTPINPFADLTRSPAPNDDTNEMSSDEADSYVVEELYIGNRNSKKFHSPYCGSLPAAKNQVEFSSRDEAINKGYKPCQRCDP